MTVTASRSTGTLFAGRYRVDSVLGRGGGADVLRAVDERLDRAVALKIPRPDATADTVRRFATEARMLARLSHPGLVEVYDYGAVAEHPYLALELVEGPTLAAVLRSGPLPAADVRHLGRDLAQTLAHVHAHGVVHRDVKPSNVLVDAAGRPRLADFGVARILDRQASSDDEALTCTGLIVGTPAYLAPEQIRGRGALASADIYALGLLLIECLTGHREYTGAPIEAAAARLHRPPAIPPHLPADLVAVLRRMTDMDPDHRPSAATCARL
ncbi:serine/threonine-protein kinase, partial [Kitasatospora sp. NPDC058263]